VKLRRWMDHDKMRATALCKCSYEQHYGRCKPTAAERYSKDA